MSVKHTELETLTQLYQFMSILITKTENGVLRFAAQRFCQLRLYVLNITALTLHAYV